MQNNHDGLDRAAKFIEQYVKYITRRTSRIEADDARQELFIVYLHVQKVYKKQRGNLDHLLVCALKNRATDLLRKCFSKREHAVDTSLFYGGEALTLMAPPSVEATVDARLDLADTLSRLTRRQRDIVLAHIQPPRVLQQEWFARKLRAKHVTCRKLTADCDEVTAFSVVSGTSGRTVLNDLAEIKRVLKGNGVAKSEQSAWVARLREAHVAQHSVNNKHKENLLWRKQLVKSTIDASW